MLDVELCGLHMKNPLILASGVLGVSGSLLRRVAREGGIGGVTTKSIGPVPRHGNLNPSVIDLGHDSCLNAVGLANPGVDEFLHEIPGGKTPGVPLIVSIFGDTSEEYARVAGRVEAAGADAIELNISCPHAKVSSIGADAALTRETVSMVKQSTSVPVFVKLNPNVTDIVEIALSAQDAGADAVVAINTVRGMLIDVNVMKPVLANKSGGLSGWAIKPVAIRAVYELYRALDIPIIGSGGAIMGLDVVEFMLAGASAVQLGTVLARGIDIIPSIKEEISAYMGWHGIARLQDIIGKAHE